MTGSSTCGISNTLTNDYLGSDPSGHAVNVESFFDHNDWLYAGRQEDSGSTNYDDVDINIGFSATNVGVTGATSGDWSINNDAWSTYTDIMLVFKGGSSCSVTGFLLNGSATNGTWGCDVFNQDTSHISAYARTSAIPVPAAIWLMGSALAGFVGFQRFKRNEA